MNQTRVNRVNKGLQRLVGSSLLIFVLLLSASCQKEKPDVDIIEPEPLKPADVEDYESKIYLTELFPTYYYWNEYLPNSVSLLGDIYSFFDSCLYSGDRWSWMMDRKSWDEMDTGVYQSYGAELSQAIEYYGDYDVKISYVHPNTPFSRAGITRGWTLTHIGDVPVRNLIIANRFSSEFSKSPQLFTFRDLKGNSKSFTISAETIVTKSVICDTIFTADDYKGLSGKVGYFNYLTFNANMLTDISRAMERFSAEGVNELIIDLRYNGGGDSRATSLLSNYIAPTSADGKVLQKINHNSLLSNVGLDEEFLVQREGAALSLDRLFVITGGGTASASEVIINAMRAFLGKENVIMVGDTTYGKPNGMYAFPFPRGEKEDIYSKAKYIFLPICFYNSNADGDFIPDSGFVPTNYRPDDLYHDWGVNEDLLSSCLYYIVNGAFPDLPKVVKSGITTKSLEERLPKEIDKPNYGSYIIKLSDL